MPGHIITPKLNISIANQRLPMEVMTALISVSATEDVEAPGFFDLTFKNWDLTKNRVSLSDRRLIDVGHSVKIEMSYDGPTLPVFYGEITGFDAEFIRDEMPTLTVQGYDLRHRLMRGQQTRSFTQMKDSAIAKQVAGTLGCTATDTGVVFDYVAQQNQTNLEFLQDRAKLIGYELFIDGETLLFRPINYKAPKTLTLNYPEDLTEFMPRLSSITQANQVMVRGWDTKQQAALIETSDASSVRLMEGRLSGATVTSKAFGQSTQVIVKNSLRSAAEAKQIAQGQFIANSLAYISGEGRCRGNPRLRAGHVIELTGVGERFSGLYYVTASTHRFDKNQGYYTHFSVRRNAE